MGRCRVRGSGPDLGLGLPVPYPAQLSETEMLMEFIGSPDGLAAPRLADARPPRALLPALFDQLREVMLTLAEQGWAHGDLSAYNVLLDGERLVVIDWPQIVDIVGNPHGQGLPPPRRGQRLLVVHREGGMPPTPSCSSATMAAAVSRW